MKPPLKGATYLDNGFWVITEALAKRLCVKTSKTFMHCWSSLPADGHEKLVLVSSTSDECFMWLSKTTTNRAVVWSVHPSGGWSLTKYGDLYLGSSGNERDK